MRSLPRVVEAAGVDDAPGGIASQEGPWTEASQAYGGADEPTPSAPSLDPHAGGRARAGTIPGVAQRRDSSFTSIARTCPSAIVTGICASFMSSCHTRSL